MTSLAVEQNPSRIFLCSLDYTLDELLELASELKHLNGQSLFRPPPRPQREISTIDEDEESHPQVRVSQSNRAVSHDALFWNSQVCSVNDTIYHFDWVFLGIPVQNCIGGMLLTYPI